MEFARHATIDADGSALTTEQRMALALITPDAPAALSQGVVRAVTQNRIRAAMAELSHGEIESVRTWLHDVARDNPAKAIELFIELAQFSLPKLKAVAVDVRSSDGSVKTMSVSELEKIVSEV
jgi:hypothetical protein